MGICRDIAELYQQAGRRAVAGCVIQHIIQVRLAPHSARPTLAQ